MILCKRFLHQSVFSFPTSRLVLGRTLYIRAFIYDNQMIMKKLKTIITVLAASVLLFSLAPKSHNEGSGKKRIHEACIGFTVIEAGKGVNCYGDTVKLKKVSGYYALQRINE